MQIFRLLLQLTVMVDVQFQVFFPFLQFFSKGEYFQMLLHVLACWGICLGTIIDLSQPANLLIQFKNFLSFLSQGLLSCPQFLPQRDCLLFLQQTVSVIVDNSKAFPDFSQQFLLVDPQKGVDLRAEVLRSDCIKSSLSAHTKFAWEDRGRRFGERQWGLEGRRPAQSTHIIMGSQGKASACKKREFERDT